MIRFFTILSLLLINVLPLLADEESPANQLCEFTWPKNQVAMGVPVTSTIVQETDSLIKLEAPNFHLFLVVEDRSVVTEESCAQYIFDDVKRHNGVFLNEPFYNMKERSVGCYYIASYPNDEVGEALMAEACYIDRMSRRIFTVAVYCTHDYDDVIMDIIRSLYIMNEPVQY